MPYEKLPIGGAHAEVLSWAGHEFSFEEQAMLRNVSRLPCGSGWVQNKLRISDCGSDCQSHEVSTTTR